MTQTEQITLAEFRKTDGFDITFLSYLSHVPEELIQHMLVGIPVPERFADMVRSTLNAPHLRISTFIPCETAKQPYSTQRVYNGIKTIEIAERARCSVELVRLLDEYNECTPEMFPILCRSLVELSGRPEIADLIQPCKFAAKPDFSKILTFNPPPYK